MKSGGMTTLSSTLMSSKCCVCVCIYIHTSGLDWLHGLVTSTRSRLKLYTPAPAVNFQLKPEGGSTYLRRWTIETEYPMLVHRLHATRIQVCDSKELSGTGRKLPTLIQVYCTQKLKIWEDWLLGGTLDGVFGMVLFYCFSIWCNGRHFFVS